MKNSFTYHVSRITLLIALLAVTMSGCASKPPPDVSGTSGFAAMPGALRTPGMLPTPLPKPTADRLRLSVEAMDPVWLKVTVDGQQVFEGQVAAHTARTWEGRQTIQLRTSNAGALEVSMNGEDFHRLGSYGKSLEQEWALSKDGRVVEKKIE